MPKNLSQIAKQKKIKYFLISFVDLFGVLRSKLVPTQAIAEMQKMEQDLRALQLGWICLQPILICLQYLILIV